MGGGDDANTHSGITTPLMSNGDFRSQECSNLLNECDIIVTNPPFSLWREYIKMIMKYEKEFIIIGTINCAMYQAIFPLIKDNKIGFGHTKPKQFLQPDGTLKSFGNIVWYTNLSYEKRYENLPLYKSYHPDLYPTYFNYDAINVNKISDIPADYDGIMGVPITFLNRYNPEQFEIIGLGHSSLGLSIGIRPYLPAHRDYRINVEHKGAANGDLYLLDSEGHPKILYCRVLIRKR